MKNRIAATAAVGVALLLGGLTAYPAFADDAPPAEVAVADVAPAVEIPAVEAPAAEAVEVAAPVIEEIAAPAPVADVAPVEEIAIAETKVDYGYRLALWAKPADTFGPQTIVASIPQAVPDLNALDSLATCGTFQADLYLDDPTTGSLVGGGVLTAPGVPTESWPGGVYQSSYSKVWTVTTGCTPPPPVNTVCTTTADGGTSTNLADTWANYDTRTAGHSQYVSGGLRIYTDNATSQAKVSEVHSAVGGSLSTVGTADVDYTSTTGPAPGLNISVTFAPGLTGTLVFEEVYGGADWWLTDSSNAAIVAPQTGGGFGSARHGTITEWLGQYPGATWAANVRYSLGSGVLGDGILHSVTIGCTTYRFNFANAPLPENRVDYTEWTAGEFVCGDETVVETREAVTVTYTNAADGSVVETRSDPVAETRTRALTAEEIASLECPTTPPTPTDTPSSTPAPVAPVPSLALTGGTDAAPALGISALALLLGAVLLLTRRRRAHRAE